MAGRAQREIERAERERRGAIEASFRARHPDIARQERAMRKERVERERRYARRDKLKDGGTPETKAKAAQVRQGSLARLYERGHITIEQLAASQEIRTVGERIGADVAIGTVSLETRVDQSRAIDGTFFERLGAVRAEVAYTRWREEIGRSRKGAGPVLAMVVHDEACSAVAKHWNMRDITARALLTSALDRWGDIMGETCSAIEEADLLAMQAGLL
ncbi:MAG: hypothetical protein KKE69_12070 [Alphaproteobacteria bacterium]|nr:hypothetical protein [Alphaproteobacteria bacterium]